MGFIFGHECNIANGHQWSVFDNQKAKWVSTGVPCNPKSNAWNHVTLKVQRTSDNHLTYQSITLNGQTTNLNWTFEHGSAQSDWYGVTAQLPDGRQLAPGLVQRLPRQLNPDLSIGFSSTCVAPQSQLLLK